MSRPVVGNLTCVQPVNSLMSSLKKISSNVMQVEGEAGDYVDSYINITPANLNYDGDGYSSALVVVSDWQWFD